LTSSGTLKLTVAMLDSIVEDFNNADITDKCATVKDAAERVRMVRFVSA